MRRVTLTVHGTSHALDAGTDHEIVRAAIVDALRRGGDFVTFTTAKAEEVSVLVSPGAQITFRTEATPDTEGDDDPHGSSTGVAPFVADYLDLMDY